MFGQEPI